MPELVPVQQVPPPAVVTPPPPAGTLLLAPPVSVDAVVWSIIGVGKYGCFGVDICGFGVVDTCCVVDVAGTVVDDVLGTGGIGLLVVVELVVVELWSVCDVSSCVEITSEVRLVPLPSWMMRFW